MSDRSVSQRYHWRLLGMVLLGLVAALTIHSDVCGPVHEAGHHVTGDHVLGGHDDGTGHGDSYHCSVDHEFSPSAVAERSSRTPRPAHADADWPHGTVAADAPADHAGQRVRPPPREPEHRSGRDILTTVCVSRI